MGTFLRGVILYWLFIWNSYKNRKRANVCRTCGEDKESVGLFCDSCEFEGSALYFNYDSKGNKLKGNEK